jgi:hypothetical protein
MYVYSFQNVAGALDHPLTGVFAFAGAGGLQTGVGSVSIVMSTEKTEHSVAADGIVMISKILGNNGIVTLEVQQTSDLDEWLLKTYNQVLIATPDQWALMTATIRDIVTGRSHNLFGMSFQKLADQPYQRSGQVRHWPLMAADIQTINA